MTALSNYALEKLREDAAFALYRGVGEAEPTHILAVAPASMPAAPESLRRLEHEYALRGLLDPAWAARPLALSHENGLTTLVLEDPGGQPLDRLLGQALELSQCLRIAIGVASALSRVHERGIIHRDIKPGTIIVEESSGAVWLTGFGMACISRQDVSNASEPLAGTFAYMPPEQIGRATHSLDTRSDLYSLGVTLYEMLTGVLPFDASDPIEWVHSHIARQPIPPVARKNSIPEALSAIVLKLLAKVPQDRYQTAAGLRTDLVRCLRDWESLGRIQPFPLGAHDVSDRLVIPEKLYGRDRESATLIEVFDRVAATGMPELVLVSGYSGAGKSSVVNELQKALVPPRGLFAAGKSDQHKRDIPYATIAQALRNLVRPLLGKSQAELETWRDDLNGALHPNQQLILNLIPELKIIIGEKPDVLSLPPQDAQRRVQLLFRRLIAVFACSEHPLVLFLDDLHWSDAATLDLVEDLVTQPDVRHLMLIGAYRDNEVNSTHPLMRKRQAIVKAKAALHEIVITPLSRRDLQQLIADTVHCARKRAAPLARLVHDKTGGNPFFAIQFLASLTEEGLLAFDQVAARWTWDLTRIRARQFTDNIADLMVGKLMRLPRAARDAMSQFACLGNRAAADMLRTALGMSNAELAAALHEPLQLGLVSHLETEFAFLHDRVQEAAYALLSPGDRAATHLRIGRLLARHKSANKLEDAVFDIVSQLNRGAALITSTEERDYVAELNLIAGRRARAAAAFASALTYFNAGASMLNDDCWERRYSLVFELALHRSEAEFLTGDADSAEARLAALARRAAHLVDRAAVTCVRLDLYMTLGRSDRAVETGLEYLRELGVGWSAHPPQEDVKQEYERIWSQLGSRPIEGLIDLPPMTDAGWRATMDVLTKIMPPALFTDENLQLLVLARMTNISLEHGNCDGSCLGYVWLGGALGPHLGDYRSGFRFGKLSVDLVEQRGLTHFMARVYLGFGSLVIPWTKHIRTGVPVMRRALEVAQREGDLTYAAFACYDVTSQLLASGEPLDEVQQEAERALELVLKSRFGLMVDSITGQLRLIRTLRALTPGFGSFNDGDFDERQFEQYLESDPRLANAACRYWIRKLQARVYANDSACAAEAAAKASQLLWALPPSIEAADYQFYAALAMSGHRAASDVDRAHRHQSLLAHHRQLMAWSESCPENFADRAALVAAEIARIQGQDVEAMRYYEHAIKLSREHGFIQNEAMANELAAAFHADRGFDGISGMYLHNARSCYLRWGAEGKVRQLEQRHRQLPEWPAASSPIGAIGAAQLDVAALLQGSQAISGELILDRLIETLLTIVIQYAGAQRGALMLVSGRKLTIEAEAETNGTTVDVTRRRSEVVSAELPHSLVYTAVRTRRSIILDDARRPNQFSTDLYLQQRKPRSVLCLALVKQTKLVGLLYLENNLMPDVFTPQRTTVLELLASQAAISLETARLYAELVAENRHRQRTEEQLTRSETLLSQAQEISGIGSWRLSVETAELHWSRELARIFAVDDRSTPPSISTLMQRVHPIDRVSYEQAMQQAIRDRTKCSLDYRIILPDGSIRVLYSVTQPFVDPTGRVELIGTVMDVTERRAIDESLRKTQSELAHSARLAAMGELLASIAHEINQPLTGVAVHAMAGMRWLDREPFDRSKVRNELAEIASDGRRAAEIIQSIRAMAKKSDPQIAKLDIRTLVEEVLALIHGELQRRDVMVRTDLEINEPEICGDKVQLQQVLLNLMMNGIEAMQPVADRPRLLEISARPAQPQFLLVKVEDSGSGIDAELASRMFETFHTTKPDGMGMGLSICRSIIEAHGGRIWASPRRPHGATLCFTVPTVITSRSGEPMLGSDSRPG